MPTAIPATADVVAECHAVRRGSIGADDGEGEGAEVEPLDVDARPGAGDGGEVERVLAGDIHRSLVRIHVDQVLQPGGEPGGRSGGGQAARLAHAA